MLTQRIRHKAASQSQKNQLKVYNMHLLLIYLSVAILTHKNILSFGFFELLFVHNTIVLIQVILDFTVDSSDAASLSKRASNNAIASKKGSLNSFTGLTGVVSSNGQQRQKKKRAPNPKNGGFEAIFGGSSPPIIVKGPQPVVGSSDNPNVLVDRGYGVGPVSYPPAPIVHG